MTFFNCFSFILLHLFLCFLENVWQLSPQVRTAYTVICILMKFNLIMKPLIKSLYNFSVLDFTQIRHIWFLVNWDLILVSDIFYWNVMWLMHWLKTERHGARLWAKHYWKPGEIVWWLRHSSSFVNKQGCCSWCYSPKKIFKAKIETFFFLKFCVKKF